MEVDVNALYKQMRHVTKTYTREQITEMGRKVTKYLDEHHQPEATKLIGSSMASQDMLVEMMGIYTILYYEDGVEKIANEVMEALREASIEHMVNRIFDNLKLF